MIREDERGSGRWRPRCGLLPREAADLKRSTGEGIRTHPNTLIPKQRTPGRCEVPSVRSARMWSSPDGMATPELIDFADLATEMTEVPYRTWGIGAQLQGTGSGVSKSLPAPATPHVPARSPSGITPAASPNPTPRRERESSSPGPRPRTL